MKRKLVILFLHTCEALLLGIFYFARGLSYVLPYRVMKLIFTGIGLAFYHGVPKARSNLIKTISTALPEIGGEKEAAEMAKRVCCESIYATFDLIMGGRHKQKYFDHTDIAGLENYVNAKRLGIGGICLALHLGSYSLAFALPSDYGVYLTPIAYDPAKTMMPRFVRTVINYGMSLGCDPEDPLIETGKNAIERATDLLRRGKTLCLPFDVGGTRIVDFFGRPAAMASGIAHFALDTGTPIVPAILCRGDKPYQTKATFWPMLKYELTGDRDADISIIMNEVAKAAEVMIREAPEQWTNWFGLGMWWKKAEDMQEKRSAQRT